MLCAVLLLLAATPEFDASFRTGLLALQRDDLNAAAVSLGEAARLEPRNGRVWVALAQTYWKLHDNAKASESAAKAAAFSPADGLVLSSLAVYYSESGQLLKAAEAQAKYSATVPRDAAARERAESLYFEAVEPLLKGEHFSEVIAALVPATRQFTSSAQLELALGVAYYGLRRFNEAGDAFLRTIGIAPDVEQPYVFLGKFLDQVPALAPQAMKQFIRFEEANPASPIGYTLHAKALDVQSIQPEIAMKLLEKAISLDGRDASAHFELGTVLDRLARYADAAKEFQAAALLDPADPASHYRLARDYDRLGNPEAARAEREKHAKLTEAKEAVQ